MPSAFLRQTATTGSVVRLALLNALLTIVTLSLWRFWGKTRVRRHLWATTRVWDDPLEYTGTGKELFIGFLLVLLILLPIVFAQVTIQVLALESPPLAAILSVLLATFVLFLVGAGLYRARRYQLTRTRWRGIRCGQAGTAWRYGLLSLAMTGLYAVSLGWAIPWGQVRLARYQLNHTLIGSESLACTMTAAPLYKRFAVLWLCGVIGIPATLALSVVLGWGIGGTGLVSPDATIGLFIILLSIPMALLLSIPGAWYLAGYYGRMAASTTLAGGTFRFQPGSFALLRLVAGNLLITTLSLGLLRPWAALRLFRFACRHCEAVAEPDFAAITQRAAEQAGTAEGFADALDGAGAF
jgi:uncharacterized membrane protein YjgN (DUF898 family)